MTEDSSIMGLFGETDSYLDELAEGDGGGPGMSEGNMLGADGMMNQIGGHPGMGGAYGRQQPMSNQYGGMSSYQMPVSQSQYNNDSYSTQYTTPQKLHHMTPAVSQGNIMGQGQQYGGNTMGSMMSQQQQQQQGYQQYGSMGPRFPNPGQQIGLQQQQQTSMWNNGQNADPRSSYMQAQNQGMPQGPLRNPSMSTYHQNFASSSGNMSQVNSYQDSKNVYNMQNINNSNPYGNVPISANSSMSSMNPMSQPLMQNMQGQYQMNSQAGMHMGNYGNQHLGQALGPQQQQQQQQQQQYGTGFMHQRGGAGASGMMGSGVPTSSYQNYPYSQQQNQHQPQGPPQAPQQGIAPGAMDPGPRLSHFQNTSPSQNAQLHPGYPGMPGQRGTTPSPRPTPPPKPSPSPAMTADLSQHSSPTSQGNVRHSSLSSVNDLMSPPPPMGTSSASSSPFHTPEGSNSSMSQTPVKASTFAAVKSPMTQNPAGQGAMGVGPLSPSIGLGSRVSPGPAQMELQRLQQQLQQVQSMPPTPQSQQTMLQLQEKIRSLRAGQEMQEMRQKQGQQAPAGQQVVGQPGPQQGPFMQQNMAMQKQQQQQQQIVFQQKQANANMMQLPRQQGPQGQQVTQLRGNVPAQGGQQPMMMGQANGISQQGPHLHMTHPLQGQGQPSPYSQQVMQQQQQSLGQQQLSLQQQQGHHPPSSTSLDSPVKVPTSDNIPHNNLHLGNTLTHPGHSSVPQVSPGLPNAMTTSGPVLKPQVGQQNLPPHQQPPVDPYEFSTESSSMPVMKLPSHDTSKKLVADGYGHSHPVPSNANLPPLMTGVSMPATIGDVTTPDSALSDPLMASLMSSTPGQDPGPGTGKKKEKKKRERKPKEPKEPKEPKAPKTPKTPKTPRTPRKKKEKKGATTEPVDKENSDSTISLTLSAPPVVTPQGVVTPAGEQVTPEKPVVSESMVPSVVDTDTQEASTDVPTPSTEPAVDTPKPEKKKKEKSKSTVKKKKKPPATFLKKKKKRRGSSDGSDVEIKITPPPTPENDDTQKRRSSRNTKRKKYLDDVDLNLSDEETQDLELDDSAVVKPVEIPTVENPVEEEGLIVEKILGMRMRTVDKDLENESENQDDVEKEDVEEYFVKYKNFSYLHCEWKTMAELEKGDKRVQGKIKRYIIKKSQAQNFELDDEELFNPDYVEVDRVLDMSVTTDPTTEETLTHYLVKWRGLNYEDSTWELQQDVDPDKVAFFHKYKDPPPEEERESKPRPKGEEWEKRTEYREYKGGNALREYQLEGVNWLMFSWYNGQNCILADEMGLGKTIQSIAFLYEMFLYGVRGPFLVVVPLSTLGNWQREFETWTDLNAIVYHGSAVSRNMLQQYEMFYRDENGKKIPNLYKFHALITTYEVIISDCELLSDIEWRCLIIDEAHRLKNQKCRLAEGLRMFDFEHRVLLTGTPLQNNLEELYGLLNFLEPERFANPIAFMADFGDLKTDNQVEKLKALLKPMMLRRLKEDVEKNLAAKEETIVEVELTNIQKKYYRAILERNFNFLAKGTGSSNVPNLLNTMMELRKCCNHPFLVKGAEEKIITEERDRLGDHPDLMKTMINAAGKLVLLDKLLPKLKQGGHKVLIFSQMIRVLDILEDYLIHKKYLYERLDGRIRGNVRQEAIDRFSKPDSDRFVFLLCTRAGGLGINLTAADTVVIYDSDWNPQNDLQAQARCHRIGQSKAVKVYRLITRNSYEREMFDRASLKLGLDKAVLQNMGGEKTSSAQPVLSKAEVEDLLKKGAYGALMEDDKAGDEFCEEDIDQILQRRTQVIQIESEGKGSTFAKASFSLSSNRQDIDINDPNFWQKWAKKADIDVDELKNKNELILQEPRTRKQTARYGNDETVMDMSELDSSSTDDEEDEDGNKLGPGRKKKGKKGRLRNKDEDADFEGDNFLGDGYARPECFKVEKNLLVYGWGRWKDILSHGRYKRELSEKDVETICRALLVYSIQHYKGDEKIKEFIWDLVRPSNNGSNDDVLKNHSGLSAPVPRGRKGKNKKEKEKNKAETTMDLDKAGINPEAVLRDSGYRRHLHRHANKVLLRVRLLYYIKQEIIGEEEEKVFKNVPISEIDIPLPVADGDPPTSWWSLEADKSLLVGVFKHGYEKFNLMRSDASLVFLGLCGPPDGAALAAEQNDDDNDDDDDNQNENSNMSKLVDPDEESLSSTTEAKEKAGTLTPVAQEMEGERFPFPSQSDLNTRLRRLITGYQRNHKKQMQRDQQKAKKMERRDRLEAAIRERETQRRQFQQCRWSRREETDFYRVVSSYGVEFDLHTGRYKWDRFRILARLEKKYDDTLTEYFQAFYHMCMRVCKKFKNDDDALPPNNIYVEPITEERASRCLARIDLLNKIRTEILSHPKFDERVKLCQTSFDLPQWWECGKHDKDLVIGAARHGVVRTDYHMLFDKTLSFHEVLKNRNAFISNSPVPSPLVDRSTPKDKVIPGEETAEEIKQVKKEEVCEDKEESVKKENKEEKDNKEVEEECLDLTKTAPKTEKLEETSEEKCESAKENSSEKVQEESMEVEEGNKGDNKEEHPEAEKDVKEEEKDVNDKQDSLTGSEEDKKEAEKEEKSIDTKEVEPASKEEDDKVEKQEIEEVVKEEPMETDVKEDAKGDLPSEVKVEDNNDLPVDLGVKKEVKEEKVKVEEEEQVKVEKKEDAREMTKVKEKKEDGEKFSREDYELQRYGMMPSEEMMMMMDPELQGQFMQQSMLSAAIRWPKDRLLFHRLEHICYCVEHGEWPFPKRMAYMPLSYDSRDGTPVGSSTPNKEDNESDVGDSGDGLKMTFHRRNQQQRKSDMDTDLGTRVQQILKENLGASASSDNESQSDMTPRSQTPADLLSNGARSAHDLDPELLKRSVMEHALMFPERRRRGRKRKAEKMAELAMAEALARREQARALQGVEPDARVPVINLEDGSRLSGDEAPLKKDLDLWLDKHPGFMVDRPPDMEEEEFPYAYPIEESQERRRGRRPRVDPAMLDPSKLTGDENVSVINRLTGKKITGAKAPPLKYLAEWLEQNPFYDVDPKWADLVKTKGKLPKSLLSRVVTPERRGRGRPRENTLAQSVLAGENPFTSMAGFAGLSSPGLMSGFPKLPLGMPFGGLPPLGMPNPMLGLAGLFPGLTSSPLSKLAESELTGRKERSSSSSSSHKKESSSSKSESSASKSSSGLTPHPSFPLMYNPLMFNPLLAAQAQSLGFSLPTSLPSSFASLAAQSSMINGQGQGDSDLEEGEIKRYASKEHHKDQHRHPHKAHDFSVKRGSHDSHDNPSKRRREEKPSPSRHALPLSSSISKGGSPQDEPTDLSMKSKPRESPSSSAGKGGGTKIQSSKRLNMIVDSLKDKVTKMEPRDKRSNLDSILNKLRRESSSSEADVSHSEGMDASNLSGRDEAADMSSPSHAGSSIADRKEELRSPSPVNLCATKARKEPEKAELEAAETSSLQEDEDMNQSESIPQEKEESESSRT